MSAIQYQLDQRPTYKDLYQFLLVCKRSLPAAQEASQIPCIASISIEVEPIDLLAVLKSVVQPNQRHFYFEKVSHQAAILGFDIAAQLETQGSDRFVAAKAFIEDTLAKVTQIGDLDAPFSGAHFFCNFSFFNTSADSDFSPAAVFLPKWQVAKLGDRYTVVANVPIDAELDPEVAMNGVWKMLQKIQAVKYEIVPWMSKNHFLKQAFVAPPEQFKSSVASALELISAQQFHKVVLAHALDVKSPIPLDLVASLSNLRSLYSSCYIFSSSNAKGSTFVGASPERLVSVHPGETARRLSTDALAGSAPRGKTAIEDAQLADTLLNSAKEMHEHQVVSQSIAQTLRSLGLAPQLGPTRLLQLSNIQHLQTPIRAAIGSDVHLLDAVAALHPTPAVAGAPRLAACEQIRHCESFERSLYAAPIGWVDHQGNGEFAVGIRSAIFKNCQARLFAGAGIVAGSTPEKELAEVQLKLQALLNAIV